MKTDSQHRIVGIDIARSLALFCMILVNFKIVFGSKGYPIVSEIVAVLEGKAAATFVVLAGVGISLMSKSLHKKGIKNLPFKTKRKLLYRALFLFVIGLSYVPIWSADILHYYGVYLLIVTLFLKYSSRFIFILSVIITLFYPILLIFFDYELGWNFDILVYENFWSVKGFVRNLFFNGFHPVFPWVAFMLFGVWLGRQPIHNQCFLRKSILISISVLILATTLSFVLQQTISNEKISILLSTSPMPPVPLYMITGCSVAVIVIMISIWVGQRFLHHKAVVNIATTGKMALTFYVAHVVVGMLPFYFLSPDSFGNYSMLFSLVYSVVFCSGCVLFATMWSKQFQAGPIERLMRKIVD